MIHNAIKTEMEKAGIQILMGTPACEAYKKNHPNCFYCISEEGCSKLQELSSFVGITQSAIQEITSVSNLAGFLRIAADYLELEIRELRSKQESKKILEKTIEGDYAV